MKNIVIILLTLTILIPTLTLADRDPVAREKIEEIERVIRINGSEKFLNVNNNKSLAIQFYENTELMLIDLDKDGIAEFVRFRNERDMSSRDFSRRICTWFITACTPTGNPVGEWEIRYDNQEQGQIIALLFFCENAESAGVKSLLSPMLVTSTGIIKKEPLAFQLSKVDW
ncbi:MAG: hypothetical protein WC087_00980 [Candidatus Paceibacterota bacterium]